MLEIHNLITIIGKRNCIKSLLCQKWTPRKLPNWIWMIGPKFCNIFRDPLEQQGILQVGYIFISRHSHMIKSKLMIKNIGCFMTAKIQIISGAVQSVKIEEMFGKCWCLPGAAPPLPTIITVQAPAGIGKSSMLKYMCMKWGCHELWTDNFDIMLFVECRTLNR